MIRFSKTLSAILGLAWLSGVLAAPAAAESLHHVHGLAYSADGKQLFVPAHYGIAVYGNGRWSKAPGPDHDYMGFSVTRDNLYSSGHPAQGTNLVNPIGLMRSRDAGRSWDKLGLEGEADFHLLATSYGTNAVYVVNHHPNSRMKGSGIYATVNQGFSWRLAQAKGLDGDPIALAVHPTDNQVAAAATKTGGFVSSDGGNTFRPLIKGQQTLAVFFDHDGTSLWVSTYAGKPLLSRVEWKTGKRTEVALPPLERDAVAYVSQNPADKREYAIATFERSVFVSKDQGKSWKQIADRGQTK